MSDFHQDSAPAFLCRELYKIQLNRSNPPMQMSYLNMFFLHLPIM